MRAGDDIGIAAGTTLAAGPGGLILAANDATARGSQSYVQLAREFLAGAGQPEAA